MSWLPEGTVLGELTLEETFVFYDGPRIFSCRSITDQMYLAAWVAEGEDADTWLYAPVSRARLDMVRSGGIPLREAFKSPEGFVYKVTMPVEADLASGVETVSPTDLPNEWLADEDFVLNVQTYTLPLADDGDEIERRARQESRTRLRLRVQLPNYTRSEAPTRKIGELLILTQTVYDNIGLAILEDDPPQRGRIPDRVTAETSGELVGLSAASFVIEIAASKFDDLLGGSVFADVTKALLSLLEAGFDHDALIEGLSKLRPRGAKSFRNFVTGLESTGGDVTVAAAGVQLPYSRRVLTSDTLASMVIVLNNLVPDEASEIRGRMRLRAADLGRKTFGLLDEVHDMPYEGKIADRALDQVNHASLNSLYDVVISEFAMLDEAIGERKPRYVLEQLIEADSGARPVQTMVIKADSGPRLDVEESD